MRRELESWRELDDRGRPPGPHAASARATAALAAAALAALATAALAAAPCAAAIAAATLATASAPASALATTTLTAATLAAAALTAALTLNLILKVHLVDERSTDRRLWTAQAELAVTRPIGGGSTGGRG